MAKWVFDKNTKTSQWGNGQFFQHMLGKLDILLQKKDVRLILIPYTQETKDLNLRAEMTKLLE